MLIFNIEQGTARSTCARTGLFCLVDRPLRRAMLNPLGFADNFFNIEQAASAMLRRAKRTARTCARTGPFFLCAVAAALRATRTLRIAKRLQHL